MSKTTTSLISVSDNCPWGIAVFAHSSGQLLEANRYMRSIYGCEDRSQLAELFSKSVEPSLAAKVASLVPGAMWSGRIYPQGNQHGISSVEVVLERLAKEPEQVWLYTLEHPIVEDALRFSSRSELKVLRVLLDNTLEYVFFRDVSGSFILVNDAFRKAVSVNGLTPGAGTKIEDFVSRQSAAWVQSLDSQMLDSGKPVVNEVSLFVFQNGTKHWLQLTTVPVRSGEGTIIGSLSVARDISDLKRTESELRTAIAEAHEASRAKGDFLAAMSHEIRTPINGIIGASELCRETPLDYEQRGYLDTVAQCGTTLLSLVNDVLDFSKIEAGQMNLESLNFSPRSLIESVADEFAQTTRGKQIELVVGYDAELPEYLLGDPTRVKQVFYNLVGNAVKFTDTGEISIRAEVADRNEDSARILFSVTDTGIGISKDRQVAIFRSFTQADMSTTRKYGGSGLGLSICKELIRLMDGTISVVSELEQGTRFEFEIPFQLTGSVGADAVPFNAELAGLRVLIVDDNSTNCDLYQQMCAGWGYRSRIAKDGVAGLSAMEEAIREGDAYRLILLDQQMPGLTGLDLASLVRARPDLRETQIILLSSSLNHEESERAKEIGVARALAKPVKRATLLEVILETFGIGGACARPVTRNPFNPPKLDKSMSVLLVEDNAVNQNLASRRLQKLGHVVTLAEDGYQAVEKIQEQRFDCILMDIQMPRMDGFEATRAIRAFEADSQSPPQYIIAMTAHAMRGDRERCLDSGMDNYIPKPFRSEQLKEALQQAILFCEESEQVSRHSEARRGAFAAYLQKLDAVDREDVLAIAPLFLKAFPADAQSLQVAVSQMDFKECYFIAHTMKGSAGVFRADDCIAIAAKVEAACKFEDQQALESSAADLIEAMRALVREVELALDVVVPE